MVAAVFEAKMRREQAEQLAELMEESERRLALAEAVEVGPTETGVLSLA